MSKDSRAYRLEQCYSVHAFYVVTLLEKRPICEATIISLLAKLSSGELSLGLVRL